MHRALHALIDFIVNTFFRRIDIVGIENVPASGPLIFAGNHPNALMDGLLLINKCGRWPIHFMASATLWKYPLMGRFLNAIGAVPVWRREDQDGDVDNRDAFEQLYEVIEAGNCMGIFPEGISHAESQLVKLKTGTARIALQVSARGKAQVQIIPCGLTYIHRHRFRSQVLLEFGQPIVVDADWVRQYQDNEADTVRKLTDHLADALAGVTLNAPDWSTLRFLQAARRLYKPASAKLVPSDYVDLSRRFVERYLLAADDPELQAFRRDIENYQSLLDFLGLKDHQLRQEFSFFRMLGKLLGRLLMMIVLLPLAIPGAVIHLPVAWIAVWVGNRFSYEQDDVATLKVLSTLLLLPLIYLAIAIAIGMSFGVAWGVLAAIVLPFSFYFSVRIIEAETSYLMSIISLFRITRWPSDIAELREERARLVKRIRALADRLADPDQPRMFGPDDFAS